MKTQSDNQRLLSLDFMRGLIMVLLVSESTRLYDNLYEATEGTFLEHFFIQFFHHPWHGLRFWDLIQPGFMFMAGTAMAYSLHRQQMEGMSWNESFLKTLRRSGWLFFWGVLDYAVRPGGLSFELWDVLTQLSFTTLVAFLIFRWSLGAQIAVSFGLLLLTEILFRYTNIPGFDQPFTDQHNFGNYMDWILMRKINDDGWVAINCIPTAAHTIWGVVVGKLLLSNLAESEKVKRIAIAGVIGLVLGFLIDSLSIPANIPFISTPIIKRIATSTFVLASGGYCLLALSFFYWWIDVKKHNKHLRFFLVIGTNSIFIYLFMEIVGGRWFNRYISEITNGLMSIINTPVMLAAIITSLVIFALDWSMCNFLYKRKIFFKL